MARVLADDASVRNATGVSEGRADNAVSILDAIPTMISRASPLAFRLESSGANAAVSIYDIRGRLVKIIRATDGGARFAWAYFDESGERVPAGVYLLRYRNETATATRKIVITD